MIGAFGVKLTKGDFVAYPCRQQSNMWLSYGIITDINADGIKVARGTQYSTYDPMSNKVAMTSPVERAITLKNVHLIVKVPFHATEFAVPTHPEYQLFQKVWSRLNINNALDIDDLVNIEEKENCDGY